MLQVVACGCVLVTINCKKSVIAPLLPQYTTMAYIVIVGKLVLKKQVKPYCQLFDIYHY